MFFPSQKFIIEPIFNQNQSWQTLDLFWANINYVLLSYLCMRHLDSLDCIWIFNHSRQYWLSFKPFWILIRKKSDFSPLTSFFLFWQDDARVRATAPVTVNIKRLSYLSPSSGISIVGRADSWRRRHAAPQLSALQTMEMPLDGANTADS